jgi:hypothetical protein
VRVVYGIPLARNFREILLGLESRPKYLIPKTDGKIATERLAAFWRKRWLLRRIENPGIMEDVSKHTLAYPITHGARVPLPKGEQRELFEGNASDVRNSLEKMI